jgi:predicted permease
MRPVRAFLARLNAPLIGERQDRDLVLELDVHLQMLTDDHIRGGMAPEEARRRARIALGGAQSVRENCRDARGAYWLADLWQDLRYAFRTLRHKPLFAVVAILTLALGIGATTVMFTVINSVLLKPLPYPDADRLITVQSQLPKFETWGVSFQDFDEGRKQIRSVSLAAWAYGGGIVAGPGTTEYVYGREISADLLAVLGVPLLKGRAFLSAEDQPGAEPVAIISDRLWQRYSIGSPLRYNGKSYTVVGIVPAWLHLDGEADIFTPLAQIDDQRMHNGSRFIHVLGRLRPGATATAAQTELSVIAGRFAKYFPKSHTNLTFVAHPLKNEVVGNVRATLWLLLCVVSLVLLIACANVASLLLARAASREREIAMRAALGARRGRLIRHGLTESAVLALVGGALGLALAALGIHPFVVLWPGDLPRATEIRLDWQVMLFALAASLLTGLVFGIVPALRAPERVVNRSTRRVHSSFVIAEIALAIVLLIAAGTLGRTLMELTHRDPGVNARNVLVARVAFAPEQTRAAWQNVVDKARAVPGVASVALADILPMRIGENVLPYSATAALPPPNEAPVSLASGVTPDYFRVMGISLLDGRLFSDDDRLSTQPVLVIDEAMARHAFGSVKAAGRRLWIPAIGPAPLEVVGVVRHVRHWGLADDQSKVSDESYYPLAQLPDSLTRFYSTILSITIRTSGDPAGVIEPLQRALGSAANGQSLYDVDTMEHVVSESLARQRFLMVLLGIFASLALLLASIGIYGVLTYLISQRVPEIGARMAIGASASDVVRLVMRQSLAMIFAGVLLGIGGALVAGRLLQKLVADARPADVATIAAMVSVLLVVALAASFLPARRASQVDPMNALRQE